MREESDSDFFRGKVHSVVRPEGASGADVTVERLFDVVHRE